MGSDVQVVLGAFPRIDEVCRARPVAASAAAPITTPQARVLRQLDEHDPMMVTELADHLGVTPSTMSLTLSRLQRDGLIRRERDPDDRRVVNVRLTPEGERMRQATASLDPDRVDALLRVLRPEDRRRAVDGLALLAEAADALVARGDQLVEALTGSGT